MQGFQTPRIERFYTAFDFTHEYTKEQTKLVKNLIEEECALLNKLSIDYKITLDGELHYNSEEKVVYLSVEEILRSAHRYENMVLTSEIKALNFHSFEEYARNLVKVIISHEAAHALSGSAETINNKLIELINQLFDYLKDLNYDGIYRCEKELHETKHAEEQKVWEMGRDLYDGRIQLYDIISHFELTFYQNFIEVRLEKLKYDFERYKKKYKIK